MLLTKPHFLKIVCFSESLLTSAHLLANTSSACEMKLAIAMAASALAAVVAMVATALILARGGMMAATALLFFIETSCYGLIDLALGVGDYDRRRAFQWLVACSTFSLLTLWGGLGVALVRLVRVVWIDMIISRDPVMRRRSTISIFWMGFAYISSCLAVVDYYGIELASRVLRLIYLCWLLGGMYLVQKSIASDDDAVCDTDVVCLVGGTFAHMLGWYAKIASFGLDSAIGSIALILLLRGILRLVVPFSKKWLGDGWRTGVPAVVFISELGSVLLFMSSACNTAQFWLLVGVQEGNALLKNLGLYNWVIVNVRRHTMYPLDEATIDLMEMRRLVLAPADNVAEVIAPVFLIVFIAFDYLVPQSPPIASRYDALLSMSVALAIRVSFAVFEYAVERRLATPTPMYSLFVHVSESPLSARIHRSLLVLSIIQPSLVIIVFVAFN